MTPKAPVAALGLVAMACAARPSPAPAPAPAPTAPPRVSFEPGTARYRRASYLHVEQQLRDQTQHTDEASELFLTVRLEMQGDRLRATFTVDSVPRYGSGGSEAGGTERARGATFVGDLTPSGEILDLRADDTGTNLLAQLAEELLQFYPRIPAGGVRPGDRWTDTTETTTKTGGLPLTVVAVSQHQAADSTHPGPGPAIPIRTTTSYSFSGSGSQGGQAYTVQGEGQRHMIELLSTNGRFLGMTAADTSTFTLSMRALDVSIPGRQVRADTLALIP